MKYYKKLEPARIFQTKSSLLKMFTHKSIVNFNNKINKNHLHLGKIH